MVNLSATVPLQRPAPAQAGVPELQQLARLIPGDVRTRLSRLLTLVCEQMGMDAAFVGEIAADGTRTVRLAVQRDGAPLTTLEGLSQPLDETWCGQVVEDGTLLVGDARDHPRLLALPVTAAAGIASYAGVVLRTPDGTAIGTLCALGHAPHGTLNARDRAVLLGLGEVAAPLLLELDAPQVVPPRAPDLSQVADAVERAAGVEELSRPLLDALHDLTGLASSYLTVIHEEQDVQEIRYARNTREGFAVPEGLVVPWADTLCKRSLDEGRACTTDVPGVWADSAAGAELGIQVYVSVPVALSDGRVWGTLCGADSERADGAEAHLPTMRLFARLIATEVERTEALARARRDAETDALTGCSSRRVVEPWLEAQLGLLEEGEVVVAVYADVARFKEVNDRYGHAAGDAVLAETGRRLRRAARPGDLVARLGGDEFLVAARVPATAADGVARRVRAELDLAVRWEGQDVPVQVSVGHVVSDAHAPAELLAAADEAMYADKRS